MENKERDCATCKVFKKIYCIGCSKDNDYIHYDPRDTIGGMYAEDCNRDREVDNV